MFGMMDYQCQARLKSLQVVSHNIVEGMETSDCLDGKSILKKTNYSVILLKVSSTTQVLAVGCFAFT